MATDIRISSDWRIKLFGSIWLLIIVLIITIATYVYKNNLETKKTELLTEITNIETEISDLKSNKDISVYNLVDLNKDFLLDLDKKSDINKIVTNILELWKEYSINFNNFYYRSWEATLEAFSDSKWDKLAHSKISNFISHFRWENDEIFTLSHISNFNWRNTMRFNVTFNLK